MLARSCLILALGLGVLTACGDDGDEGSPGTSPTDPTGMGNPPGLDSGIGLDAGLSGSADGGPSDGGTRLLDGRVLGGGDAGCAVSDPQLGCGEEKGAFVRFDNGIELDRTTGLAWAPVQMVSSAHGDEAERYCDELSLAGVDTFTLPTVDQLRTLAAGCADSATGGSCKLAAESCVDYSCGIEPDSCSACEVGKGPHASGGFCRPELADCVNTWSQNSCDDKGATEGCPTHRRWYYDGLVGSFALSQAGSPIHGRCVVRIATAAPSAQAPAAGSAPPPTPVL